MKNFRPLNSIRHPLWWSMLGLLILNDFCLKTAGILPGFITGKLSDFAGLMVLPVLVALILGNFGGRKRVWTAIHIAIGVLFAAINLLPSISSAYVGFLNTLGFNAHNWMDPTDLVALAVLPVSFIVYPRLTPMFKSAGCSPVFRFAAVAFAGFFCLASSSSGAANAPRNQTSYNGNLIVSDVAFVNGTESDVSVQIEKYKGAAIDCNDPNAWSPLNDKDNYQSTGTFTQHPGEVTTLLPAEYNDAQTPQCKAVRLTINNIESIVVVWDPSVTGVADRSIQESLPILPQNISDNTILLTREKKDYYMVARGKFHVTYWNNPKYAVDYWKM